MSKEVLLFTTPSCAKCPSVKASLEKAGVVFESVNAITDKRAKTYNIRGVPSVVVVREDSFETFTGADVILSKDFKERYESQ